METQVVFERMMSFLRELPTGGSGGRAPQREDDPRIAAAALLYHVMNADGVRQDVEWETLKDLLARSYSITGDELEALVKAGEAADQEAIDLYAFTSVLRRHLDDEARVAFIGLMWDVVFADGELNEMEDNILWRVAELIGVDRRDRIAMRQAAQKRSHVPSGPLDNE